jgi:hypothetical protein
VSIDDKDQIIEINPNSSAACAADLAATRAVGRRGYQANPLFTMSKEAPMKMA